MTTPADNLPRNILVVEDSRMFARILKASIEADANFKVLAVENYAELKQLLSTEKHNFFASLLDLNLPDAPNGEVIDYVLSHNIPSIVFTGKFDDDLRDRMLSKGIVDYVLKESPASVEYIVSLLKQLHRNTFIKALIVDDSRTARLHIKRLLSIYRFTVLEAENGEQALEVLNNNRDIRLIVTDFNMPVMDGFELAKRVRNMYNKQEIAIIGMSAYGNNLLSARFLKIGGSDFINKPFLEEEFFCRVNQNMDLLEYIKDLRFVATRDFLTGLYNRRHFFDVGEKLFARAQKAHKPIAIALIDVDFFKHVNDTYGHDIGDLVLKEIGNLLNNSSQGNDLIARFGGEEFCFLLTSVSVEEAFNFFDNLRLKIAAKNIKLSDDIIFNITASFGVCITLESDLETALIKADKLLYTAKKNGRNQVIAG